MSDLAATAIFVGGSSVSDAEAVLDAVKKTFFGPFRVSVLFDASGANTTAAAAARGCASERRRLARGHLGRSPGATGPVGQRAARLLCRLGARVSVGSRSLDRAAALADDVRGVTGRAVTPFAAASSEALAAALRDCAVIIAAGAAGVTLLPASIWKQLPGLRALIDLNAVPPAGAEDVEPNDKNALRGTVRTWARWVSAAPR